MIRQPMTEWVIIFFADYWNDAMRLFWEFIYNFFCEIILFFCLLCLLFHSIIFYAHPQVHLSSCQRTLRGQIETVSCTFNYYMSIWAQLNLNLILPTIVLSVYTETKFWSLHRISSNHSQMRSFSFEISRS